jgi:hypothetical protein
VWQRVQDAGEQAYDRSAACEFTSLIAYEWSGVRKLANLHRNVIFRTRDVPAAPTSHFEAPTAFELWTRLQSECREGLPGCDVLAIPHNSNWSNGNLFIPETPAGSDPASLAQLRADLEPLLEVYQHKGDSECMNGVSGLGEPDELCDFEKLRTGAVDDCGDGVGSNGIIARGCVSRLDFLRGVLLKGMQEEAKLGVNPYRLGVIASTDTHNGTPGKVEEVNYSGHFGNLESDPVARLTAAIPAGPRNSGGGLVAVWAEENSREAIFDALRRREVYGTSGPRIAVRMFAGWDFPADLCERADLVEVADPRGVPMGGVLGERPRGRRARRSWSPPSATSAPPSSRAPASPACRSSRAGSTPRATATSPCSTSPARRAGQRRRGHLRAAGRRRRRAVRAMDRPGLRPGPADILLRARAREPDLSLELARLPGPRRRASARRSATTRRCRGRSPSAPGPARSGSTRPEAGCERIDRHP